jgi:hypothetical protein
MHRKVNPALVGDTPIATVLLLEFSSSRVDEGVRITYEALQIGASIAVNNCIHKWGCDMIEFGTGEEMNESALMDDFQASRVNLSLFASLLCVARLGSCP